MVSRAADRGEGGGGRQLISQQFPSSLNLKSGVDNGQLVKLGQIRSQKGIFEGGDEGKEMMEIGGKKED